MTKKIKLRAEKREGEKAAKILREGFIPVIVYGSGFEPQSLKVKMLDFSKVFTSAGESRLIELDIEGQEPVRVIVKDIQRNAVKNNIIHIDFYHVDMKKEIIAQIPLHFVGESKAVKEAGGILIKNMNTLEVKCLPGNLIDYIDIDLSVLNSFHDAVRINDIKLPEGIKHVSETNEVVANIAEPAKEEKAEAAPAPAAEPEPAKEEKAAGKEAAESNKK